ncbi:hypothetical protein GCM10007342_14730 [Staphylococcus pragensis]|uniref:LPXTG cell wall anchor domain-containing protein n=1 Tax=Staphylococcus pragensis TaxID=1611836 RepID=UPI00143CCFD6|nr:LPXTG cell wall anchor domain-containing protein [Staphylococcus pragensis]GGG92899.1 hypothetical protein GCM10007342_14730 [Staphylococcus pragensis]
MQSHHKNTHQDKIADTKDKLPLTGETKQNNSILLSILTAIFGSSLLLLRRKNTKNK